nr:hypothetical protein [Baekduia soli]
MADAGRASCTRSLAHGQREARVEDPARVQRRRRVVDDRQGRDRRQARRVGGGHEELADAAVGDAHHADLVVQHPRLACDGLDHVVAVEALQRLEVVERAARAARAAHVDVDDRVAQQRRNLRDRALAAVGVGVAVARVLDQRGERPGAAGRGQVDVDGQLRAVAHGQVAVAVGRDLLAVHRGAQRRRPAREHREGGRPPGRGARAAAHAVARARRDVAEHRAAQAAGPLRGDLAAAAVQESQPRARRRARDLDLLDAAAHGERRRAGDAGAHGQRRRQDDHEHTERAPERWERCGRRRHGATLSRGAPARWGLRLKAAMDGL